MGSTETWLQRMKQLEEMSPVARRLHLLTECASAQKEMAAMPEWVKAILRSGPYVANRDEESGRWYFEPVSPQV